ncbi:GntR family transcriptional regulator [Kaistia dalseonensis]|uniref:DNA-binding GntR family transcriptional regulator n=1 Tax=Kaistia dalseonensis TaxID=410840 RepID=A0ABU0H316_9HYPH|nr:GntR family transcriptional regulator [Kaistia dalseonensis]MCX5493886.1 GntR family transcriptional regulator [Kaistia dalseonensis]MDQ0436452.1 DNA-binding GntR family transcriptional regulator [Kaistia dalseonensis]
MTETLAAIISSSGPRYRTATEYVEATLKRAILDGTLAPGTPLRQEDLAATFKVSRMPIREALRQLEAQALVDFEPHRGAVVVQITLQDAMDNYAIRGALEPQALRLSMPHLTDEDFSIADEILSEIDQESDPGRMGELNRRFHMTLYAQAGLPRLIALTEQHLATADRYLRFHLAAVGDMGQDEHRALLAACRGHDEAKALAVLATHHGRAAAALQAFFRGRSDTSL